MCIVLCISTHSASAETPERAQPAVMRTNIVIDDDLMARAKVATGIETKRGVVEAGLRLLVRLADQEEIRTLRGVLRWEGDLDASRRDR